MLWSEFQTAVNNQLGVEANRKGTELMRDQHMRNAVVDLQRNIPTFREGNTTTYVAANLSPVSQAMLGAMPVGALPKAFYIYGSASGDNPYCKRYRLDWYPWSARSDMTCGRLKWDLRWSCGPGCQPGQPLPNPCPQPTADNPNPYDWCRQRAYVYSISPHGDQFLIYPALTANMTLLLVWDGYKMDFNSGDNVPYPEEAADPVAEWMLWRIRLLVDKNPQLAQIHRGNYLDTRRALIRDFKRTQYADGKDEEYASNLVAPPGQWPLTAGATVAAFLGGITAISGTTPNCLAAIPTAAGAVAVGATVQIIIGEQIQVWQFQAGTAANAGNIQRPNDFDPTANPNEWVQQFTIASAIV